MIDVAVVGAGAAGLMAAIAAAGAAPTRRVVAFDGAARLGAKILIAGGGRCNVTHREVGAEDFHGSSRNAIAKVLRSFSVGETIAFFREAGVALKEEETGKLFPTTNRAKSVLDALVGECGRRGVRIRTGARIRSIEQRAGGFDLVLAEGSIERAARVILATGGRSVPQTGSDGAGYEMVRALGHSVSPPFPALVPLVLPNDHWLTELRGASARAEVRVRSGWGKLHAAVTGSILMTHFGLSGPAVLDISRHLLAARAVDANASLELSFFPEVAGSGAESSRAVARAGGRSFEDVLAELNREATSNPHAAARNLFRGVVPERVAESIVRFGAELEPSISYGRLDREGRRRLARAATALAVQVLRDRGWNYAEVTAGGVPLSEVNLATMESRLVPGLHLCGEICDVDGRIGGFNFQWAWSSGKVAGEGSVA